VAHCANVFADTDLQALPGYANLTEDQQKSVKHDNSLYQTKPDRNQVPSLEKQIKAYLNFNEAEKKMNNGTKDSRDNIDKAKLRNARAYQEATMDLTDKEILLMEEESKSGFINMLFIHTVSRFFGGGDLCSGDGEDATNKMIADENGYFFWFKYITITLTFTAYIVCFLLIVACMTSINACKDGISSKIAEKNADGTLAYPNNCKTIIDNCEFDWLAQNMNVQMYVQGRLFSYIVSLLPLFFMAYASQRHLKNVINQFKNKMSLKDMENADMKLSRKCGSCFEKDELELLVFFVVLIVHFVMGAFFFSMDIQIIQYFENDDKSSKCKDSWGDKSTWETFIIKINPEVLAGTLLGFNVFGMLWATVYVFSHLKSYFFSSRTKKLEKRIDSQKTFNESQYALHPVPPPNTLVHPPPLPGLSLHPSHHSSHPPPPLSMYTSSQSHNHHPPPAGMAATAQMPNHLYSSVNHGQAISDPNLYGTTVSPPLPHSYRH
jgi:hypothetical protein